MEENIKGICKECGKEFEACYCEPTKSEMLENSLCFNCHFWTEKVGIKDNPNVARIDGEHYYIGEESNEQSKYRGFYGRLFIIQFADGRIVKTNNLWHNGDIPDHFKDRLPDNATFLERN